VVIIYLALTLEIPNIVVKWIEGQKAWKASAPKISMQKMQERNPISNLEQ
jgi:hypothetical protein